jgi:hypothetical protein
MDHIVFNAATGQTSIVPFTAEEIAAYEAARPDPKITLLTYAYQKRRDVIDSGMVVMIGQTAVPVWTDSESRSSMQGLMLAAQIDPQVTTTWKGRDGNFYPLDAAGIQTMALAALAFVQQAFATEAELVSAINSGVITTTNQINGGNWPSNN